MKEAMWKLPDGHKPVACFVTLAEAEDAARALLPNDVWAFYITDKRGSWEVICYRKV